MTEQLDLESLARLFGADPHRFCTASGSLIDGMDLRFTTIAGRERDELIVRVLRRIHAPDLDTAGQHRAADWDHGWRENLDEFLASSGDTETLVPKYYKRSVPVRLNREYVLPVEPDFVNRCTRAFKAWLFAEYLADVPAVYEFGCGTGHNLVQLGQLQPGTSLHGFDWAPASQQILAAVADRLGLSLAGRRFDFFAPDPDVLLQPGAAVLTFGALEQVGSAFGAYLDFVLERRPRIVIDVIGIEELYDENELLDYLALVYHRRRAYLSGYLTRLRALETEGRIEILRTHHQMFGNLYDDPHSYVIWRPR